MASAALLATGPATSQAPKWPSGDGAISTSARPRRATSSAKSAQASVIAERRPSAELVRERTRAIAKHHAQLAIFADVNHVTLTEFAVQQELALAERALHRVARES